MSGIHIPVHWVVLSESRYRQKEIHLYWKLPGFHIPGNLMAGVHIPALVSVLLVLSIAAFDGVRWHKLVGPPFVGVFVSVEPIVFVVATFVCME